MENLTLDLDVLILAGLKVTPWSSTPTFILLLFCYIIVMVTNVGLVVLIFRNRSLHQPMYLLFCNLMVNHACAATAILPHILKDIFTSPSKRHIYYMNCVVQAFCVHFHGSASFTVLTIMAFDRYVAICKPLRYASIMTNKMVLKLSVAAWGSALVMVVILLGLTVRLSRCRRTLPTLYCDNASLFGLSCESVIINNIYGLTYTVLLFGCSVGSITLTYLKITAVCVRSKNKALNRKALRTCASHVAAYLLLMVMAFIDIILHRFPHLSDYRKMVPILGHATMPVVNAMTYGGQIKQVRQTIKNVFNIK